MSLFRLTENRIYAECLSFSLHTKKSIQLNKFYTCKSRLWYFQGWGGGGGGLYKRCPRVTKRGRGTPSITHALDIDLVIELWRVLYIAKLKLDYFTLQGGIDTVSIDCIDYVPIIYAVSHNHSSAISIWSTSYRCTLGRWCRLRSDSRSIHLNQPSELS